MIKKSIIALTFSILSLCVAQNCWAQDANKKETKTNIEYFYASESKTDGVAKVKISNDDVYIPIKNGKINGEVNIPRWKKVTFKEDGSFSTDNNITGRTVCSLDETLNSLTLFDKKDLESFFKCLSIEHFVIENFLDNVKISFDGAFQFPNITKDSVLTFSDFNNISKSLDGFVSNAPENVKKYQSNFKFKEVLVHLYKGKKDLLLQWKNENGSLPIELKLTDFNLEYLAKEAVASIANNKEEQFVNAFFKTLTNLKITNYKVVTPEKKKDLLFDGVYYPLALYAKDNSIFEFYNPDEKAVLRMNRENGMLAIDLLFPKSAKKLISAEIDIDTPVFSNMAEKISQISSKDEYSAMLMTSAFLMNMSVFTINNLKLYNPEGNVFIEAKEFIISSSGTKTSGQIKLINSAEDYYTFDILLGSTETTLTDAKGVQTTIKTRDIFDVLKQKDVNNNINKNIEKFISEIKDLPPTTLISVLYSGMLEGYTMAMSRHQENSTLDYLTRCYVIAQTTDAFTFGKCTDLLNNETVETLEDNILVFKEGSKLSISAKAKDKNFVKKLKERLGSSATVTYKEGAPEFIVTFQENDTVKKADKKEKTSANTKKETKKQEKKETSPQTQSIIDEILNDKTNSVLGNPNATFVIIEFFDYNCGWCKKMNKSIPTAIEKSDNIRWILIDAPIFGEKSELISRYALAAGKQGKFKEFHEAISDASNTGKEELTTIAKTLGLDVAKLEKDADSEAIKSKITKNKKYIKELQLSGVPMFIINGEIVRGAFSNDQLDDYIEQAEAMKTEN